MINSNEQKKQPMNFRERIERRRELEEAPRASAELEEDGFDADYFGIENVRSLPASLVLRLPEGKRRSIPYMHSPEFIYDPSEGIEIITHNIRVKIIGRDLTRLFDYLAAYRVKYIQPHLGTDAKTPGLFVEEIKVDEI